MKTTSLRLSPPFFISSRLAPAVRVADAVLSYDSGRFVFDFADGSEHEVEGFSFPRFRIAGATDESELQDGFAAVLSFLSACAESRAYATRRGKDASEGENSDLFPASVGAWAEANSDAISMAGLEISETAGAIARDES